MSLPFIMFSFETYGVSWGEAQDIADYQCVLAKIQTDAQFVISIISQSLSMFLYNKKKSVQAYSQDSQLFSADHVSVLQ